MTDAVVDIVLVAPSVDIMLVEDDGDVREALTDRLEAAGYRIAAFQNGLDALEWLRGAGHAPQLILLDLMMPVMDGWQFREEQLKDAALAVIPLVVLSARSEPVGGPVVEQLPKPIKAKDLLLVVARHCGPRTPPA